MTTPAGARAARQLVRDCQHRDEWICCWTCATAALARAAQGAQPVGALIHEIAIAAADRFVVLHCRPDHITLTQGALLNLSYTIKDAIRQYLARAAQPPDGPLLTCPWCGETQRDKIANAQISHLIECGDRLRAAQGTPPVGVVQSYSHWVDGQYVTKPYPTTPEPQARQPE